MLSKTELIHWTNTFGVADEQIRRDHLISHILAAIADLRNKVVFYGGTALSRTLLPEFRLSEDIDLMGTPRLDCAQEIEARIPGALRREFGRAEWVVAPTAVREPAAALLQTEDGLSVRVPGHRPGSRQEGLADTTDAHPASLRRRPPHRLDRPHARCVHRDEDPCVPRSSRTP